MKHALRVAFLSALALLLPQLAAPSIPTAAAASSPTKPSKKNKRKSKPRQKKLILAGRHHKKQHTGRPA